MSTSSSMQPGNKGAKGSGTGSGTGGSNGTGAAAHKVNPVVAFIANVLFSARAFWLFIFLGITVGLAWSATHLRTDAGFRKMIPLDHPYMKTFLDYQKTFGGANRTLVALRTTDPDIYNAEFFKALKGVTDDVFFIPGVDRPSVQSLFTPNVRYIEVVEEGFSGGNVVPANFSGSEEDLEKVKVNVLKSGRVGRLVSNDFKGALVSAELLEIDPTTGAKLDYAEVARKLEAIRAKYQSDTVQIHIIGFAKAVGDISEGAKGVLQFFGLAFLITALLLSWYSGSVKLTVLALICAIVPVVWLLGLLPILGYGIDPMSILVPFLIFSIGVSHAVQMTNAWKTEYIHGADSLESSRRAFVKLFMPGAMALLANALGFLVMLNIHIDMVRELAVTASIGVAVMIITNKMLLTVLLSYVRLDTFSQASLRGREGNGDSIWTSLGFLAKPGVAIVVLALATVLTAFSALKARELRTGDLGKGIPELRDSSRYNQDTAAIVSSFTIGVDVLSVIAQAREGIDGACTEFGVMDAMDRFETHVRNVYGVQSTISLPATAKLLAAANNEGNPRWRVLARNRDALAQSVIPVDTATGLLNTDCSAMQILVFTSDHQGETISHILREIKAWMVANESPDVSFRLASGNVGVMAATNEAVESSEVTMLLLLFASIGLLCFAEFRSLRAVMCILVPLAIVSVMCNALMAILGIGLKVSTLPVIALGVGVGVDYGIYLYERMKNELAAGADLPRAFASALQQRGSAALFTAVTMAIGVGTWAFSALKFQADMGILLAFMFLVNMLGAVFLLPAMASILLPPSKAQETKAE